MMQAKTDSILTNVAEGIRALADIAAPPEWLTKGAESHTGARAAGKNEGDGKWCVGERNDRLTSIAGSMRARGCSRKSIEAALLQENRSRCDPPLDDKEVNQIARSVSNYPPANDNRSSLKLSQASKIVRITAFAELFHTPDSEAYAAVTVNSHREVYRLHDRAFKSLLARAFHQQHGSAPSAQGLTDAMGVLEGKALYEGPEHPVFTRIARIGSALYIDLGDETWSAVKITRAGWKIVSKPKARFRRPRGLQPLPRPERDGELDALWRIVNVREEDRVIILVWLLGAFQFEGPFFILVLNGEQGTAKSTAAKALRRVSDPNQSPLRTQARDQHDLMIAAKNGWVVSFDNISFVNSSLSDALCSLATGGGFATRRLYTDDDEVIFDASRPILLNGIDGVAIRGDLLDRSLVLNLPVIERRLPQESLWAEFERAIPRIFGAVLDGLVQALKGKSKVDSKGLPRMADAASWAVAGLAAFGYRPTDVLGAIKRVQTAANTVPLEASPIVPALRRVLHTSMRTFEGTATLLLLALSSVAGERKTPRGWPTSPQALSAALRRLAPNLRAAGVEVEFHQTSGPGSQKFIHLTDVAGHFSDARDAFDAEEED